jgi:hypothetical protein
MLQNTLRDRTELTTTAEGEQYIDARRKLSAYGKGEQKIYHFRQVVESSTRFIAKNTTLSSLTFFDGKSTDTIKFPDESCAYDFEGIRADIALNLAEDEQGTLMKLQHFLRNSLLIIKVDKTEKMRVPLDQVVPFVINYVDGVYTKQEVRPGFVYDELMKLSTAGLLQISIEPAPGYKTDANVVIGIPELDKETNGDNYIRISLFGTSISAA